MPGSSCARDSDGMLSFDAKLDLTGYDLPDDARVFVEAYRQTSFMRFPHGTVAGRSRRPNWHAGSLSSPVAKGCDSASR